MADLEDQVAKICVRVMEHGSDRCLMARKRSKDADKNDHLEFLGGHLDEGDSPTDAIRRELEEEEATGGLAAALQKDVTPIADAEAGGAHHYLFYLEIDAALANTLEADPEESLGLRLVETRALKARELDNELTSRTRAILDVFSSKLF